MTPSGPVLGADGLARCPWAAEDAVNRAYHDTEWGRPIRGESAWLERITLEAFQSGLSWLTILNKRPAFREVFAGFDADEIASFGPADVNRLMTDARIVRNRRKIDAAITNARATVALRADGGLEGFLRGFAPQRPSAAPVTVEAVPASTHESVAMAKALRHRGFAHVGPTTMYAMMQATGLVDDHLAGCHARGSGSDVPSPAGGSG